mmetsp:Transcript_33704/g.84856  ORF Transcript_33704/g.84856 Transcript_33704/m.84856 type:complete len:239 (+) Transcript_33704:802-1518(+)
MMPLGDTITLVINVEGVHDDLQLVLDPGPAPLRGARGEGVELPLGDGHDGQRVALVVVGLGDVLQGVVQVAVLVLALRGLEHLGLRARDGKRLGHQCPGHLVGVPNLFKGLARSGVDVQGHRLQRLDDVLVHGVLPVHRDLLPPHGVVELVPVARVLQRTETTEGVCGTCRGERGGGGGNAHHQSLAPGGGVLGGRGGTHGGDSGVDRPGCRFLGGRQAMLHEGSGLGGDAGLHVEKP